MRGRRRDRSFYSVGQGPRSDDPAVAARARGPGNRVIEPIPAASGSDQDLVRRRALMFATPGFNELVRVPAGMEAATAAADRGRSPASPPQRRTSPLALSMSTRPQGPEARSQAKVTTQLHWSAGLCSIVGGLLVPLRLLPPIPHCLRLGGFRRWNHTTSLAWDAQAASGGPNGI